MSKSTDDGSMASFVVQGLHLLLKQAPRKFKQLRTECETILDKILAEERQAATNESKAEEEGRAIVVVVDTDADKYFLPFRLACESGQTKLMAIALDSIQKLIAYGYLDGASIADPAVYPPKTKSSSVVGSSEEDEKKRQKDVPEDLEEKGRRKLISVIVECFYECSLYKDAEVQLQVIKAILTAVTSVSCQVHDHSLLQSVTACYQIYLQASNDINRTTAKATLTQIFNLVFQRMEHFANQLKQLEQSAAQSALNQGPGAVLGEQNGPIIPPLPAALPASANGQKPGKRGYCVVCGKGANNYCLQTRDPV
jgi:brefeldin A-inhibited guanine nucleotide-exchange protein